MTALATDSNRVYELGDINQVPVKGSSIIYQGAAVGGDDDVAGGEAVDRFAEHEDQGFAGAANEACTHAADGHRGCGGIDRRILGVVAGADLVVGLDNGTGGGVVGVEGVFVEVARAVREGGGLDADGGGAGAGAVGGEGGDVLLVAAACDGHEVARGAAADGDVGQGEVGGGF